jgi:APA family basic amino acid/polyamine antiporter
MSARLRVMSEATAQGMTAGGEVPTELKRVIGSKLLFFFVLGDILGTGIYALIGSVAGEIGGALWVPFVGAFLVAFLTAFSYLELVGKYPTAAGAALYANRAFGIPFLTFIVAFAVMSSGITSASSAAVAFGKTYLQQFITLPTWAVAITFIVLLALINFRGSVSH